MPASSPRSRSKLLMKAELHTLPHRKERCVQIIEVAITEPGSQVEGDYGRDYTARGQVSERVNGGDNLFPGHYTGRMGVRDLSESTPGPAVMYLTVSYEHADQSFEHSFERETPSSEIFRSIVDDPEVFEIELRESLERGLRQDGGR